MKMWVATVLVVIIASGHFYKILGLFPDAAKSHVGPFFPLMRALALKGHQVTFVSHYEFAKIAGLEQLVIDNPNGLVMDVLNVSAFVPKTRFGTYLSNVMLAYNGWKTCYEGFSSPTFRDLLNRDDTFDIVILEFFNTDCFAPFAFKFQAVLVGVSSCLPMHWTNERFANVYNPSYIPFAQMDFSDRMTFWERVENTVVGVFNEVLFNYLVRWNDERIARTHFGESFPSVGEIVNNVSVLLTNAHFSLNLARPEVPQVVEVGGMHIEGAKKLPQVGAFLDFDGYRSQIVG
ncbi:hypothetical protein Zmor_010059 [Zophobas morio]|uniref:UDP-glucuronosyltransferase n=1 Tax=Zophobas morio TaxID=2755281 RepID=A0AA38MJB3_9CUCU|nr:hypothetical protein Zmor_010059 [Zophobas morio]